MENNMLIGFLLRLFLRIVYAPLKLFPVKKKVVMISREFDEPSEDFLALSQEIKSRREDVSVVFLCKTIGSSAKDFLSYSIYLLKVCYHLATSFVCVVDTYCIPVSVLKHKKSLTVIQIWHALGALKKFGFQTVGLYEGKNPKTAERMCMHKNYDLITCASKKTAEFYAEAFNTDIDKIKVIGMPRIDCILTPERELKERFLSDYPNFRSKKIILYVPTFRKGKEVNYKPLTNFDETKYALIVKPHILSKNSVEDKYLTENYSTNSLMKIADCIITDYSAVSFEASLLSKPLYFYLYDINEYKDNRGLNIDITKEMPSECYSNADDLIENIMNGEYNFEELKKFRNTYVETDDRNNSKRIVDYILNCEVKKG